VGVVADDPDLGRVQVRSDRAALVHVEVLQQKSPR
jgi:hypothetical protein